MDIVKWLRESAKEHNMYRCDEAADEIERLREALHDCIYVLAMDGAIEGSLRVIEIASVALQQKESE